MQARLKSQLWSWLPVLLWLAVIGFESTSMLSSNNTGSILYDIVAAIFGPVDNKNFEIFHSLLRKTGHFVGYAILSLLFFRALVRSSRRPQSKQPHAGQTAFYIRLAAMATGFTFLVASLDEWHQTFLPSRTGAFRDVLLDTAGAIVILAVALAFVRRRTAFVSGSEASL